jgi:hypothetical protein
MFGAQTAGTEVKPLGFSISFSGDRLYVRHPAPPGMLLGMAYLVAPVGCFSTQITLSCQRN